MDIIDFLNESMLNEAQDTETIKSIDFIMTKILNSNPIYNHKDKEINNIPILCTFYTRNTEWHMLEIEETLSGIVGCAFIDRDEVYTIELIDIKEIVRKGAYLRIERKDRTVREVKENSFNMVFQ